MPMSLHPQYVTDDNGKRISVILSIEEFNILIQQSDTNFQDNKSYFQKSLENIENSTTTTLSHNKVWESIDKHTKAS